jgi:hypothetical protein
MVPFSSVGFYRTVDDLDASLHERMVQAWLNGEVVMAAVMS